MANAPTTIDELAGAPPCAIAIRQAGARDEILVPGFCHLLKDAVEDNASVGFLAPIAETTALRYWRQVFESIGRDIVLWAAEDRGRVVGSVQLALCPKENGRHRAEVQKLLVLRSHRGRGIASRLLRAVDAHARANNRTLLYLDTIAGSPAESVYRHLGWSKSGEIPDYAAMPDGEIRATAIYYKRLG